MFSRHALAHLVGAGLLVLTTSLPSAALPVLNESFELGTFVNDGNGTMVLPVGSNTITDWTVVVDQLAWIIGINPWGLLAQDGDRFLDLTAYPGGAPFGGVTQTLGTIAGHQYELDYYLGSYTQRWGGPPVSIVANAGGTSQTCSVTTTSTSSTWTLCSMSFVAGSASTLLSFAGTAGFQYIGLDNVTVEDVTPPPAPEPAQIALVAAGVVVLLARRRAIRARS